MPQDSQAILFYVHDPMCSWCWAFAPTWAEIKQNLPEHIKVRYLLGGLAPDSNEPMPSAMQAAISGYWRTIMQKFQAHSLTLIFGKNASLVVQPIPLVGQL